MIQIKTVPVCSPGICSVDFMSKIHLFNWNLINWIRSQHVPPHLIGAVDGVEGVVGEGSGAVRGPDLLEQSLCPGRRGQRQDDIGAEASSEQCHLDGDCKRSVSQSRQVADVDLFNGSDRYVRSI